MNLYFVGNEADIALFWKMRDQYMLEDVLPNATFAPATDEERVWFFSEEYRAHIMKLFSRETDTLRIAFLQSGGKNIGFAVYVIYHSEDGKCFIIDFCIDKAFRNQDLGTAFFAMLRAHVLHEDAAYFALNLSNENNERFWKRNGFVKTSKDEYGNDIYEKRPL